MSHYEALIRASDRARTLSRARQRDAKRKLFEVDDLDADLFDGDESEAFEIAERNTRYAEAHNAVER